jgi:cell division protease FtsH
MQEVDGEVRKIIDEQYALARKLIEENADKMHAMAKALLDFETIDADQIKDIMEGKPPRPPREHGKTSGSGGSSGSDSSTPNAPVTVTPTEPTNAPAAP